MTFQSTHPRGVRLTTVDVRDYGSEFQSTHPRGVRQMGYNVQSLL